MKRNFRSFILASVVALIGVAAVNSTLRAQATAETNVAIQEALKQKAKIEGFGSFENYIQWVMAGYGLNPFQPQYIIGGTQQAKP